MDFVCGAKTRARLRPDTELRNFPLFCPKCKAEFVIDAKGQQIAVIEGALQCATIKR